MDLCCGTEPLWTSLSRSWTPTTLSLASRRLRRNRAGQRVASPAVHSRNRQQVQQLSRLRRKRHRNNHREHVGDVMPVLLVSQQKEFLSVKESAQILNCTRDTVLRCFANEPGVKNLAPRQA